MTTRERLYEEALRAVAKMTSVQLGHDTDRQSACSHPSCVAITALGRARALGDREAKYALLGAGKPAEFNHCSECQTARSCAVEGWCLAAKFAPTPAMKTCETCGQTRKG